MLSFRLFYFKALGCFLCRHAPYLDLTYRLLPNNVGRSSKLTGGLQVSAYLSLAWDHPREQMDLPRSGSWFSSWEQWSFVRWGGMGFFYVGGWWGFVISKLALAGASAQCSVPQLRRWVPGPRDLKANPFLCQLPLSSALDMWCISQETGRKLGKTSFSGGHVSSKCFWLICFTDFSRFSCQKLERWGRLYFHSNITETRLCCTQLLCLGLDMLGHGIMFFWQGICDTIFYPSVNPAA